MNEPNPIYWLERKQAWRGRLYFFCVLLGIFRIVFDRCFLHILPFGVSPYPYSILYLLISFLPEAFIVGVVSWKLSTQRIEGDLILNTPLSAKTILCGKLKNAALMILWFLAPFALLVVVTLFVEIVGESLSLLSEMGLIQVFLGLPTQFMRVLFWTMIALGFLAGSRTQTMRILLLFLALLFAVSVLFLSTTMLFFRGGLFPGIRGYFISLLILWTSRCLIAVAIFRLGIVLLPRDANRKPLFPAYIVLAVLVVLLVLALFFLFPGAFFLAFFFGVPCVIAFGCPVLAMEIVRWYDRRSRSSTVQEPGG